MLKLSLAGCTGRMGQVVLQEITQSADVDLIGALTRPGNPLVGQEIGDLIGKPPLNLFITGSPKQAFAEADVIIDFSCPEALDAQLQEAIRQQKPYVLCVTGLNEYHSKTLTEASKKIPVLNAPNTSLGIAVLRKFSYLAAKILGSSYDISIVEMHQRQKADAPSGTSLSIAKTLTTLEHLKENAPPYPSLSPRPPGTIECATLRGGSTICDHSVIFAGEKDLIRLEHRTLDRALFAQGAIKAAQWLVDKPVGLYTIDDVVAIPL